jgi:hypothetical protein
MSSVLASRLSDFIGDMDRARHLLMLISAFKDFGGSISRNAEQKMNPPWTEIDKLAEIAPHVRTDLPILAGSLHLYICGRFEYFVRDLVIAMSDNMIESVSRYAELPDELRSTLFSMTLSVASNPTKYGYSKSNAEQLIMSLAANLQSEAEAIDVNSDILAITESNMNARMFAEIFKRVGVKEIWNDIAKQAPLKSFLTKRTDADCRSEVTMRLDSCMKDRNTLAHPTSSTAFPDVEQVDLVCQYFRVLGQVLVDVLSMPR